VQYYNVTTAIKNKVTHSTSWKLN